MTPERFNELISQHRCLDNMIDRVRLVDGPPGCVTLGYRFDGYIDGAVIYHQGRYYDLQDINLDEGLFDCHGPWDEVFSSYESLEALVEEMGRVHDQA